MLPKPVKSKGELTVYPYMPWLLFCCDELFVNNWLWSIADLVFETLVAAINSQLQLYSKKSKLQ